MAKREKKVVVVKLEISGDLQEAFDAVNSALDEGVFQDAVNDRCMKAHVKSATAE